MIDFGFTKPVQGVIFDLDGTLVDTMPLHGRAWEALAHRYTLPFSSKQLAAANGKTTTAHIRDVFEWASEPADIQKLAQEKRQLFLDLVESDGVTAIKGLHVFLKKLVEQKVSMAVGTSAPQGNADLMFKHAQIPDIFSSIIGAEDVTHGKPAPEVFLKAAQSLSLDPKECLVIEDAPMGIAAARAAGMPVIALTTTHSREELADATRIIDTYLDL